MSESDSEALDLTLADRVGWPDDLRVLYQRFPREMWEGHENLGDVTQFWLARHAMFRALVRTMARAHQSYLNQSVGADGLLKVLKPRAKLFIEQFHIHQRIEEEIFFPRFSAFDHRFAHGFDVLEADHDVLHDQLVELQLRTIKLEKALTDLTDDPRPLVERSQCTIERMRALLQRHLLDEEELAVPMILHHGEAAFGLTEVR